MSTIPVPHTFVVYVYYILCRKLHSTWMYVFSLGYCGTDGCILCLLHEYYTFNMYVSVLCIYSVVSSCQSSHLHCVYVYMYILCRKLHKYFIFNIYSLQVIVALMAVCLLCCTDFD